MDTNPEKNTSPVDPGANTNAFLAQSAPAATAFSLAATGKSGSKAG
jgi:hypothetical protein